MAQLTMLRSEFPQLRHRLDFAEFHEGLKGNSVDVWLNPSVEFIARWEEHKERIQNDAEYRDGDDAERGTAALFAELWGCEADEAYQLLRLEADPGIGRWLMARTWQLINEHRAGVKEKNLTTG